MKIVSAGPGHYESADERVLIYLDDSFQTECDLEHPHPMRIKAAQFNSYAAHYQEYLRRSLRAKANGGYMVWQCPGGETHFYSRWVVQVDGDWTENVYETFNEAVGAAERALDEKITVSRRRKPQTQEVRATEDTQPQTQEAALNDDWYRAMLDDELAAIGRALERYEELMRSEDAPYVDQELHATHLQRRAEIEQILV